jgi:hypothetical protein
VSEKRVNTVFEPEREEIMEGCKRLKMGHIVLCTGSLLELGSGITTPIVQLNAIAHVPTIGMIKLRRLG